MKKVYLLLVNVLIVLLSASAQTVENGVYKMSDQFRTKHREQLIFPKVNGYEVLKCDFHIHTVFSDGSVWPNIRLQEVWEEGLDVMSITEHMEYSPHKDDVSLDKNRPYELIKDDAAQNNIVAIRGSEVTRQTPPGHFNAIFLNDNNKLIRDNASEKDYDAVRAAHKQGAFIFWNHPGWKPNIEGSYEWIDFVDRIHQEGMLHGIEVMNGAGIHLKALDWCIEHNISVIGTSDVHNLIALTYDMQKPYIHRTMTLVLSKDRSMKSIREALDAGRTIAWSSKYLAGKEEVLRPFVESCIEVLPAHHEVERKGNVAKYYEVKNNSSLYLELSLKSGNGSRRIVLPPMSSQVINAEAGESQLTYECDNTFVRSDKKLEITLNLR